jgi:dihydrofolate reductase
LYPALLSARLIDKLILMTFPVVLGRGKRIFDGSETPGTLKLVDHAVSDTGVVFASYEPDGEVRTGTFATKEPSAAEVELREKMKAGNW